MDIVATLQEQMKLAMKAGQKDRLQVVRMLLSEAKNADLAPGKPTPIAMVEAYAKKLRKSAEEYEKMGRPDEVAKFRDELLIVEEFLPKKLSKDQTEALVTQFLASGAYTEKQAGQAMGAFMKQHGTEVDPGIANPLIRQKLAGK